MDTSVPIVPIIIAQSIYFCEKHEPVVLSPQPPIAPTPQDNRALLEEKAKQIAELEKQLEDYKALTEERFNKLADLTALVQTLVKK